MPEFCTAKDIYDGEDVLDSEDPQYETYLSEISDFGIQDYKFEEVQPSDPFYKFYQWFKHITVKIYHYIVAEASAWGWNFCNIAILALADSMKSCSTIFLPLICESKSRVYIAESR